MRTSEARNGFCVCRIGALRQNAARRFGIAGSLATVCVVCHEGQNPAFPPEETGPRLIDTMAIEIERDASDVQAQSKRFQLALHSGFALTLWTIFELLPLRWASALGGFIAAHIVYHLPFSRHLRTNIGVLFPHYSTAQRNRLARQMAWNIGRTFAEYPHLAELTDPANSWITLKGWEVYQRAKDAGRPVIFASGHLANWELTAGAGARRGVPVTVVYAPRRGAAIERRLQRYRQAMDCGLTPRGDAARPIIRRLSHKECVGIIVDQRADDGIMVPFFGRPAPTTAAPARLAIKFKALIVPVECRRLGGPRFEVTFHEPIKPEDFRDADDPVYAITRRINEHLQEWILDHPSDWQCRRRRWPKWQKPPT
jgi:KDO2-lipid IV(A) lauroyltransferase